MAPVRKHGDKWQARVQRKDQPSVAKSLSSKSDALKWARSVGAQLKL